MNKKLFSFIFTFVLVFTGLFAGSFANIANAAVPNITSISPISGKVGDIVTINGENFTGVSQILFGSINIMFETIAINKITVKVPVDAVDSKITIKTTNGDAVSGVVFKVISDTPAVNDFYSGLENITIENLTSTSIDLAATGLSDGNTYDIYLSNNSGKLPNTTYNKKVSATNIIDGVTKASFTGLIQNNNYVAYIIKNNDMTTFLGRVYFITKASSTTATTTTTTTNSTLKSSGLVPVCNTIIDPVTSNYSDPCDFNMVMVLINTVISFLLIDMATPLFALILIYVGWLYLSAGDSSENVTKAKKILKNAVIGYIIALAAFLIVKTILSSLGFVGDSFLG